MAIHFILLCIVFLITYIYRKCRDSKKKKSVIANILLILVFLILIIFTGLRDINVGTDTSTYVSMFINKDNTYSNLEILFPLISQLVHFFTNKYFVYLTILSFILIVVGLI